METSPVEASAARPPAAMLRATIELSRARYYRRRGGPWSVGTLDDALSASRSCSTHEAADDSTRLAGEQLESAVASVAGGLVGLGVRRGDVVAWQIPNGIQAFLLYRACWRLGAVAAPLHHAAREAELSSELEQLAPRVLFAARGSAAASLGRALVLDGALPGQLPAGAGVGARRSQARPSDLAVVLFTSGSTGAPKAVLHTHRGLAYKAVLMREVHGLGPDDAVLMPAPLAHISGLLNGVLVPGTSGMRTRLMSRWDPARALDLVQEERISFMVGPPTFFVGMASVPGFEQRVASLRLVSSGGASVTPEFVASSSKALDCTVKRTYGSTEAPTVATSREGDDPDMARESDGRAVGEVELRVSDPGTGRRLPPGSPGELWVRGPELFVGYADPAATAAAHARGSWFRTGDLATLDSSGWLRIVGRIKDLIIRGGENVSVPEVEANLEAHPDVRQAAVVPYPDDLMGERVAAFVVAGEGFDLAAARAWFESRGVARYKAPERLIRIDAIPMTEAGKPDRPALKELARRAG
jgi:cyclohexanecarboxylate-CoA ligase